MASTSISTNPTTIPTGASTTLASPSTTSTPTTHNRNLSAATNSSTIFTQALRAPSSSASASQPLAASSNNTLNAAPAHQDFKMSQPQPSSQQSFTMTQPSSQQVYRQFSDSQSRLSHSNSQQPPNDGFNIYSVSLFFLPLFCALEFQAMVVASMWFLLTLAVLNLGRVLGRRRIRDGSERDSSHAPEKRQLA